MPKPMQTAAIPAPRSALNSLFDIEESVAGPHTQFKSPMTRHLYEWWIRANGGKVPLKRCFDITEHRSIVANIFLTQLMPDGEFEFKLNGEAVIEMIGRNSSKGRVKSSHTADYGHALEEYYRSIVRERVCKLCTGSLAFVDRGHRRFESVDCPISSDGRQVDFIIGVIGIIE